MTIKRNVQLPRSSVKGAKPRVDELDYGNLAVNFFAGDEFLSTKNSSNEVVVFPSKNYIEKHPFSSLTLNKIKFDGSSSIQNLTDETSSKTKLNITAEDEHLYYNGKPIANVADSRWEAGTGTGAVLLKGSNGKALGELSVSEGTDSTAYGTYSHAEGLNTYAGDHSHAEGDGTSAFTSSHAEGQNTYASGFYSHTEGSYTKAVGSSSHAEGNSTTANGKYSHAEGNHTIAMNEGEHACGSYNRSVSGSGQVFSVGVGTSNDNRVNSFYVKNDGTIGSDLDMSINANSKITLSTTSDRLIMSGGTLTTNCTMTTGAHFTTSDERLKTNIIDVTEDEIEKVKKVDLKSFNLKRDGKKHFGVVAQEVETAGLAELVNTDSEGMKSVDYTSLLILKIAELEKEIKDLKNQINKK